jgi:DNA-binding NarL/FixJ family response regulator
MISAKNTVYVVTLNPLAGEYLRLVLGGGEEVHLRQELPRRLSEAPSTVTIVFDRSLIPLVECVNRMRSAFPDIRFVVVDRAETNAQIVRLLLSGVHGFVEYGNVQTTLKDAVCAVRNGDLWVSGEVLKAFVAYTNALKMRGRSDPQAETPREAQVFELLEQRLSNKQIGKILGIELSTVKYHVSNLLGKLQIGDRHSISSDQGHQPLWHQLLD